MENLGRFQNPMTPHRRSSGNNAKSTRRPLRIADDTAPAATACERQERISYIRGERLSEWSLGDMIL